MKKVGLVGLLLVLIASFPAYGDSIVRVQCEEEDIGTEIYLNGKFAGECPVDAPVKAGTLQLRARKPVKGDFERIFEKQLRVVDGVAQRVEIILSAPQLTAEGKHKQEVAEANARLRDAEAGDISAMQKVAEYFDTGMGVEKDSSKAKIWRDKADAATAQAQLRAANEGDIGSMENIAARYAAGRGVSKDASQALAWRERAEAAKREKLAQEEAAKREKLAQEKIQAKQAKLSQVRWDEYTSKFVNGSGIDNNNVTSILVTGFPLLVLGAAIDLISSPTKTTEINKIKNEAALRPSTWGKPDSMIAQASQQQKTESSSVEQLIMAVAAK